MNDRCEARSYYRSNYVRRLCEQNRIHFDSPHVWNFGPEDLPLQPRSVFPNCVSTLLEIGFGHGEVLEEMIPANPTIAFFGIERRLSRVKRALKRLNRIGADNTRLLRLNLELLRDPLFIPGSFDQILINHPDPWPKERHGHHRFLNGDTIRWFANVLRPSGYVEVASDHPAYFFTILRHLEKSQHFESELPPPFYTTEVFPNRVVSRFEKKKRRAGKAVRLLKFTRK